MSISITDHKALRVIVYVKGITCALQSKRLLTVDAIIQNLKTCI